MNIKLVKSIKEDESDLGSRFCAALREGNLDIARQCIDTIVNKLIRLDRKFDHSREILDIQEWLRQRDCIRRAVTLDRVLKSMPPQVLIALEVAGWPSSETLGLALSLGRRLEVVSLSPMPAP